MQLVKASFKTTIVRQCVELFSLGSMLSAFVRILEMLHLGLRNNGSSNLPASSVVLSLQ